MKNKVLSLLEYSELPEFRSNIIDVESYANMGKFELEIEIEGSGGYYTSDNKVSLNRKDAESLLIFIQKSIEKFDALDFKKEENDKK